MTGKKPLVDHVALNTLLTGEGPLPDDAYLTKGEHDTVTASLRATIAAQRKQISDLRKSLKYARKRAELAEVDAEKQKQDKLRYKDFCVRIFTNTVDFHAEGKTIRVTWLIKEYTKLFNSVQPFYWG